jgi:hypothetical protein
MQTLLVLAAVIGACSAYGILGYGFPPSSLLTCMVQNPHAGLPGQEFSLPETPPFISFQPGEPGTVYLPVTSGFPSPIEGPLPRYISNSLFEFLEPDLRVTSIGEEFPRGNPIVPGTILPTNVPVSSGDIKGGGVGTTVAPNKDYGSMALDVLQNSPVNLIDPANYALIVNAVVQLTDRCQVNATWTRLPHGQFFPQWISGAFCSGENCSFFGGLKCNAVLREETLIPILVLRWDCCWSIVNRQFRWECGWRKVYIALIGQCTCSCFDEYSTPFSYTGRLGGSFMPHIDRLNT